MAVARYLRVNDVVRLTGLSSKTIRRYVLLGTFPEPIIIGIRSIAWPEPAVEKWIKSRPRLSASVSLQHLNT